MDERSTREPTERDPQESGNPETPVQLPDLALRRNPADMDIQEGQERMQADPPPPPGKLKDYVK